ncbi:hypothetical protein U714_09190, partial [Rhodobacter capsulatus DE442]
RLSKLRPLKPRLRKLLRLSKLRPLKPRLRKPLRLSKLRPLKPRLRKPLRLSKLRPLKPRLRKLLRLSKLRPLKPRLRKLLRLSKLLRLIRLPPRWPLPKLRNSPPKPRPLPPPLPKLPPLPLPRNKRRRPDIDKRRPSGRRFLLVLRRAKEKGRPEGRPVSKCRKAQMPSPTKAFSTTNSRGSELAPSRRP